MTGSVAGVAEGRRVLVNVQGLRAAAAMLVVLHHLKAMGPAIGAGASAFSFAALGVDLFFVISGFIMVLTTDVARIGGGRFLANRIARVVPLYWLITLAVFALAQIVPALVGGGRPSAIDLVRSLLFIPYARVGGRMEPVLFLGWSLNYEMFFYLVFALALTAERASGGRVRHVSLSAAVIGALVLIGLVVPMVPDTLAAFYTNPKMIEFVAGMGLARLLPRLPASRGWAAAAVLVGSAWLVATPALFAYAWSTFSVTGAASLILVGALMAERGGWLWRWRPLVLLGDASYSLYLVHPFATQAVVKLWQRLGGVGIGPAPTIVLALAALVAAAVGAIVTWRLVETPLSRWARRLLDTRRGPVPAGGL